MTMQLTATLQPSSQQLSSQRHLLQQPQITLLLTPQQSQQHQRSRPCQLATAAALFLRQLIPLLLTALLQRQGLGAGQCLTLTMLLMSLTLMLTMMTQHQQQQHQQRASQQPLGPGGAGLTALRMKSRSQQQQLANSRQQQSGLGQWTGPQPQLTSLLQPQRALLQLHQLMSPRVMHLLLTHPLSAL
jgi:hypothetical protein